MYSSLSPLFLPLLYYYYFYYYYPTTTLLFLYYFSSSPASVLLLHFSSSAPTCMCVMYYLYSSQLILLYSFSMAVYMTCITLLRYAPFYSAVDSYFLHLHTTMKLISDLTYPNPCKQSMIYVVPYPVCSTHPTVSVKLNLLCPFHSPYPVCSTRPTLSVLLRSRIEQYHTEIKTTRLHCIRQENTMDSFRGNVQRVVQDILNPEQVRGIGESREGVVVEGERNRGE